MAAVRKRFLQQYMQEEIQPKPWQSDSNESIDVESTSDDEVRANGKKGKKTEKLYCVCQKPYDESEFMIGCDGCSNWFHGRCVSITPAMASTIAQYYCSKCIAQQRSSTVVLGPRRRKTTPIRSIKAKDLLPKQSSEPLLNGSISSPQQHGSPGTDQVKGEAKSQQTDGSPAPASPSPLSSPSAPSSVVKDERKDSTSDLLQTPASNSITSSPQAPPKKKYLMSSSADNTETPMVVEKTTSLSTSTQPDSPRKDASPQVISKYGLRGTVSREKSAAAPPPPKESPAVKRRVSPSPSIHSQETGELPPRRAKVAAQSDDKKLPSSSQEETKDDKPKEPEKEKPRKGRPPKKRPEELKKHEKKSPEKTEKAAEEKKVEEKKRGPKPGYNKRKEPEKKEKTKKEDSEKEKDRRKSDDSKKEKKHKKRKKRHRSKRQKPAPPTQDPFAVEDGDPAPRRAKLAAYFPEDYSKPPPKQSEAESSSSEYSSSEDSSSGSSESSSSEAAVEKDKDKRPVYCICKKPYDNRAFMIRCVKCKDWFHGTCVGIAWQEAKRIKHFTCPSCGPRK